MLDRLLNNLKENKAILRLGTTNIIKTGLWNVTSKHICLFLFIWLQVVAAWTVDVIEAQVCGTSAGCATHTHVVALSPLASDWAPGLALLCWGCLWSL